MRLCSSALASLLVATSPVFAADEAKSHKPTEVDLFPLFGGSSDVGVGGGVLGAVAHFAPGEREYRWRVEAGALVTYNPRVGLSHFPYTDIYALLTVPNVAKGVRLEVRPSYTRETTQGYYGLGNASAYDPAFDQDGYYEYGRTHPTIAARARLSLGSGFYLRLANYLTYNSFVYEPNGRLSQDIHSTDPVVKKLVDTPGPHWVDFFEYALVYDTRDDEWATRSGVYHEASLRYSPGGTSLMPYRYEQLDATARFYTTLPGDRITLAFRVVGDVLFDHPPFYELARYQDTFALGGGNGVRGIPGQRYYGKVKVFGNLEARARLFEFHMIGKDFAFGVAGFFDAGRLWADTEPHPELDGTTLGLKYGAGGGIRLQQDATFVVRVDLAWSPDAHPLGGYFAVGEIF